MVLMVEVAESPNQVGLVALSPLGNVGIVVALTTMQMRTLAGMNEDDEPESVAGILEADLSVGLIHALPDGDVAAVVVVGAVLLQHVIAAGVDGRDEIEVAALGGLDAPLKVVLIYPRPHADVGAVVQASSFHVDIPPSRDAALDGDVDRLVDKVVGGLRGQSEAPLDVVLVHTIPLRDRGAVVSAAALYVDRLVRMLEEDIEEPLAGILEADLGVALIHALPKGDLGAVIVDSSQLMKHTIALRIQSRNDVIVTSFLGGLDEPLKVRLFNVTPKGDFGSVVGTGAKDVGVSTAKAALKQDGSAGVSEMLGRIEVAKTHFLTAAGCCCW